MGNISCQFQRILITSATFENPSIIVRRTRVMMHVGLMHRLGSRSDGRVAIDLQLTWGIHPYVKDRIRRMLDQPSGAGKLCKAIEEQWYATSHDVIDGWIDGFENSRL